MARGAHSHGGAALPYDAAMLMLAVLNEAPLPRRVRVVGTEIFNAKDGTFSARRGPVFANFVLAIELNLVSRGRSSMLPRMLTLDGFGLRSFQMSIDFGANRM